MRSRRQSLSLVATQAQADHAATRALAIAKWQADGGVYQSHPDIQDKQVREDVEAVECSLSVLEDILKDLQKWCADLNLVQRTAVPFASIQRFVGDLDKVAFKLDERVFVAFDRLDLLSPAARDLAGNVDAARKKRRAETAMDSGSSTPRVSRPGSCTCRKAPACQTRCPCVKAGQKCTPLCLCGDDCYGELLVL